jgi:hypothetical protein
MNKRTLILSLLVALVWLNGCQKKSPAGNAISIANASRHLPEVEQANVERITGPNAPDAAEIITKYNSRDIGSAGWRRVSMELLTDGALTRAFTVFNIWRTDENRVRTLFLLEEPEGLSGTAYLLQELNKSAPEMQVHLFLPAGDRRVLEVDPSNFDQGLLGSDFTYNDVRMRLPMQGYRYRLEGKATLQKTPAWVLEAEPSSDVTRQSSLWKRARFYLACDFQFLLGADYSSASENGQAPPRFLKQMRVQNFEQRNGFWTATRMFMFSSDRRSTALTLLDARFGVTSIDSSLFEIDQLPFLADKIKHMRQPENQRPAGQ